MKKKFYLFRPMALVLFAAAALGLASCDDDDGPVPSAYWINNLSTKYENPAIADRNEKGSIRLELLSDKTLNYLIEVDNLTSGDQLTGAAFYAGDVISNGNRVLNLNPVFSGGSATGSIMLRSSFADSLVMFAQIYINVTSQQHPEGLVRGQINTDILLASDIALLGSNEAPPVTTTALGTALIRLTTEKKVYSTVTVNNLEADDALTMAHIHRGAVGVNGAVLVMLCASAADFGVKKATDVSSETITTLLNEEIYVNAHSANHTAGVVRGQVVKTVIPIPATNTPEPY